MTAERECVKWKCPGPEAVLRCRDCGGCCMWWTTPHLTRDQVAGLGVGARFEADCAYQPGQWEVTAVEDIQRVYGPAPEAGGAPKVGPPTVRLAVKPLHEAPKGKYWFEVEECGGLHYWYELKGEGNQGGCGGTSRFAELARMGQAVLL